MDVVVPAVMVIAVVEDLETFSKTNSLLCRLDAFFNVKYGQKLCTI